MYPDMCIHDTSLLLNIAGKVYGFREWVAEGMGFEPTRRLYIV